MCIGLGVFEFVSAYLFYNGSPQDGLIPDIFYTYPEAKILFCTYIITLGCQRLTYGLGRVTTGSWIALVITHIVELIMWWSFAYLPSFRNKMNFGELLQDVVQLKSKGGFQTAILLVGVPMLVGRFLLSGGPPKFKVI